MRIKVIFVYFLDYLSARGLDQDTVRAYGYNLKKHINFLSKENEIYSFGQINEEIINNYSIYLKEEGLNNRSIRKNLEDIKAFYHFMLSEGYINVDISNLIELPRIKRSFSHDVLSPGEVNRLLDDSNFKGSLGQRDQTILGLFYATGIRMLELLRLNIDDVDMENQELRCSKKGTRERIIHLEGKVYQSLNLYLDQVRPGLAKDSRDSAFFLGRFGRLSKGFIIYMMQRYRCKAGIKKEVSSYILRHTFATRLLEEGTDIKSIQMILGHPNTYYTQAFLGINGHPIKAYKKREYKSSRIYKKVRLFCQDCIKFRECKGRKWEECEYRNELLKVI